MHGGQAGWREAPARQLVAGAELAKQLGRGFKQVGAALLFALAFAQAAAPPRQAQRLLVRQPLRGGIGERPPPQPLGGAVLAVQLGIAGAQAQGRDAQQRQPDRVAARQPQRAARPTEQRRARRRLGAVRRQLLQHVGMVERQRCQREDAEPEAQQQLPGFEQHGIGFDQAPHQHQCSTPGTQDDAHAERVGAVARLRDDRVDADEQRAQVAPRRHLAEGGQRVRPGARLALFDRHPHRAVGDLLGLGPAPGQRQARGVETHADGELERVALLRQLGHAGAAVAQRVVPAGRGDQRHHQVDLRLGRTPPVALGLAPRQGAFEIAHPAFEQRRGDADHAMQPVSRAEHGRDPAPFHQVELAQVDGDGAPGVDEGGDGGQLLVDLAEHHRARVVVGGAARWEPFGHHPHRTLAQQLPDDRRAAQRDLLAEHLGRRGQDLGGPQRLAAQQQKPAELAPKLHVVQHAALVFHQALVGHHGGFECAGGDLRVGNGFGDARQQRLLHVFGQGCRRLAGLRVELQRFEVGIVLPRHLAGPHGRLHRLGRVAGEAVVVSQRVGLRGRRPFGAGQHVADQLVVPRTLRRRQTVVERLADLVVDEAECAGPDPGDEQLRLFGRCQRRHGAARRRLGRARGLRLQHPPHDLGRERAAGDRGDGEHVAVAAAQAVEPAHDRPQQVVDVAGKARGIGWIEPPAVGVVTQRAAFGHRVDGFERVQRMPLRLRRDRLGRARHLAAQHRGHEGAGVGQRQGFQHDGRARERRAHLVEPALHAAAGVHFFDAPGQHQQQRVDGLTAPGQVQHELQAAVVGPLQVIEHEHQRGGRCAERRQQPGEQREQPLLLALGLERRDRFGVAEQRAQLGHQRQHFAAQLADGPARGVPHRRRQRLAREGAQRLDRQPVAGGLAEGPATAPQDRAARPPARGLADQSRLAHPRRPCDRDDLQAARRRLVGLRQQRALGTAAEVARCDQFGLPVVGAQRERAGFACPVPVDQGDEVRGQAAGRAIAVGRVLARQQPDDLRQRRRRAHRQGRCDRGMGVDQVAQRQAGERVLAGQQLDRDDA